MAEAVTISIEGALSEFLAEQRLRLGDGSFRRYLEVVDLLVASLNGYGHDGLSGPERRRFMDAYDAGDEQAFCITCALCTSKPAGRSTIVSTTHLPQIDVTIVAQGPRELASLTGVLMATVRSSGETHTPN